MRPIDYVPIMDAYYQAQGFPPYRWLNYETSPWTPLKKGVRECRLALLTTGGISRKDQLPFSPISLNDFSFRVIPSDTAVDELVINDYYYDHDDAVKDINIVFPIERFRELEREGYIKKFVIAISGPCGRFYKRRALEEATIPQIVEKLREVETDALFIVPACVLDHETAGFVARKIEEMGVSTIYVGVMRDIMTSVRPSRSAFLNFPEGHNIGKPFDRELQLRIMKDVLKALEIAKEPGTLVALPYSWHEEFSYVPGAYRRRRLKQFITERIALGKTKDDIISEMEDKFGEKIHGTDRKDIESLLKEVGA